MIELPDWLEQMLLGAGGGAVIAFGLFKFWGQSWIKNRFAKDLESAKSEISFHAARRMKLHDKEYEVFPEIWSRLIDARNSLSATLNSFISHPDFNSMGDDKVQEWLNQSDLEEDERSYFLEEIDQNKAFVNIIEFRNLRDAETQYWKFLEYLQKNKIFLSPEIKDNFNEVASLLRKVWAAKKVDFRLQGNTGQNDLLMKAFDLFENEVEPLMKKLENLVQIKLFPESTPASERGGQ